ncbi:MAG: hypothetical protein WC556_04070 [Candidatus Methanoperedens sp.]
MTRKTEEAIKIAEQIQEDILHEKEASTQTLLRQYYSLVTLLDKDDEVEWALNELNGYRLISKVPNYRKRTNNQNRHVLISNNCGMIEGMLRTGKNYTYNCIEPPQTPLTKKHVYSNHIANTVSVGARDFFNILNTLTNLIYTKTQQILLEIKFGKFELDIFEETRKVVDTELSKKCPKAFEKLTEAYEDLMKSDSHLAFQQTAHACRVILKDFADATFPVGDKKTFNDFDGKPHPIKDDDYINRIIACVQENTNSKSDREFIKNSLIYLGNFLKSINDLASIGTHHEISKEDANRCLIYTYLVLGDIIKLLEKH